MPDVVERSSDVFSRVLEVGLERARATIHSIGLIGRQGEEIAQDHMSHVRTRIRMRVLASDCSSSDRSPFQLVGGAEGALPGDSAGETDGGSQNPAS